MPLRSIAMRGIWVVSRRTRRQKRREGLEPDLCDTSVISPRNEFGRDVWTYDGTTYS
jgi:hypothetical protein